MILEHDDTTQHVDEWALDYGIPADLIALRIAAGWTTADAIETPMPLGPQEQVQHERQLRNDAKRKTDQRLRAEAKAVELQMRRERRAEAKRQKAKPPSAPKPRLPRGSTITHNGEALTIREWADRLGIKPATIYARRHIGMSVELVLTPDDFRAALTGVEPTIFITFQGERHTLAEWSRITGLKVATLHARRARGLTAEDILQRPLHARPHPKASKRSRYVTANGRRLPVFEWSRITGIASHTLLMRLDRQGWTEDQAINTPVRRQAPRGAGRASDTHAGTGAHPTAQI